MVIIKSQEISFRVEIFKFIVKTLMTTFIRKRFYNRNCSNKFQKLEQLSRATYNPW